MRKIALGIRLTHLDLFCTFWVQDKVQKNPPCYNKIRVQEYKCNYGKSHQP